MMNAAAPEGTPPRRIIPMVLGESTTITLKNFLTFPCPEEVLRLGLFAIKSVLFNCYGTCWFHTGHLKIPHQRHCCVLLGT